jgi:alkylated DNA repair dioxygenase AlkB
MVALARLLLYITKNKDTMSPSGLTYIAEYITRSQHDELLAAIDLAAWQTNLKRRVQHYGYRYDYKARSVDRSLYLGKLPYWAIGLAQRLLDERLVKEIPDQLIVNEYQPGQGISPHIDCISCFREAIASLSLGSSCMMDFACPSSGSYALFLEARSIIVMTGESRYRWRHSIKARRSDIDKGIKKLRDRRISLTFRKVLL